MGKTRRRKIIEKENFLVQDFLKSIQRLDEEMPTHYSSYTR
jgi:hypothetical protein